MCEPISTTAAVLGGAKAVAGGAKAIAGHESAKRQTYLANKGRVDAYKAQLDAREMDWRSRLNVYNQRVAQYDRSGQYAQEALGRGYAQAQEQLSDVYRSNQFATQAQGIETQKALGAIAARGATGASSLRMANSALAAYGRNQAIMEQNILGARNRFAYSTDQLRNQYMSNRNRAYGAVANRPQLGVAPVEPTLAAGPSNLGLFAGLGQAAVSGFSTYESLQADNPINPLPEE